MKQAAILLLLFGAASAVMAQPAALQIGYVYPAGGRQGTTFQIRVGGQNLDGVNQAAVSGPGVQARVLEVIKPMTQKQFNDLREKLQELQKQPKDAETSKQIADIRKQLAKFNRNIVPAIAEKALVQITIAAAAVPGEREIRLATPHGISNPLVFCVGQLPEVRKPEPKEDDAQANPNAFRRPDQMTAVPPTETAVTLPAVINGQILQGGVDSFRFLAGKGQSLVAAVAARRLIPYLADAVPGWFQPVLALYDAKGRELAYQDDFDFRPDPVLHCVIPEDGEYRLEIKDSIYRGREDFVYRISVGEIPFVTGLFPLGGKAGEKTDIGLSGWNLSTNRLVHDAKNKPPGVTLVSARGGKWVSNTKPFALDTWPEMTEEEEAARPSAQPRPITLPVIINGRVDVPGDADVFRFEGRAGERIVAEVMARRLDSPLDSVLKLTDAAGRTLAFNDDHEDKGSGLNTHHADSYLEAVLPGAGAYELHLGDAQRQGGPGHAYRLRIGPPRPDFALRVAPSRLNLRSGASAALTVFALRKDGFTNDIALSLRDAPEGFVLGGAVLPAGQDQVRVTVTAPVAAPKTPVRLSLEGRATIRQRETVRPAVPCEDMMQAFAYRHLVPSQELLAVVSERGGIRQPMRILDQTPVRIPAGQTVRVRINAPARAIQGRFDFELSEPPEGLRLKEVVPGQSHSEIVLECDAVQAKPGLRGNLILNVLPGEKLSGGAKPQPNKRRTALAVLPAIPFEVAR